MRPPPPNPLPCKERGSRGRGSQPRSPNRLLCMTCPSAHNDRATIHEKKSPTNRSRACSTFVRATVRRVVLPDEHGLIERAQRGSREAFTLLVEHYWDRLYRWLYHLTHDRHTAEDVAQESFLKAFANLASFRAGSSFQAWLFRIGHNNLVNIRRAVKKKQQAFPEQLMALGAGPAEEVMSREALQVLARAIGRLPQDFRAAFLLRVEEDLSFREIAEVLQTTEETARWRVFKARQKLMENLAPHLDREEP